MRRRTRKPSAEPRYAELLDQLQRRPDFTAVADLVTELELGQHTIVYNPHDQDLADSRGYTVRAKTGHVRESLSGRTVCLISDEGGVTIDSRVAKTFLETRGLGHVLDG
jgi:hypothetical protein